MPPVSLYKFQKLNVQTIQNLKNAGIYFNIPASFNDPFDCSILEASVISTDEKLIEILNHYINKHNITLAPEINPNKYIDNLRSDLKEAVKKKEDFCRNKIGCACFSEIKDNILMWSHYADGHKGICLEFDGSVDPFNEAIEVVYSYKFPSIDPMTLLGYNKKPVDHRIAPLLTKYEGWRYEKEWRLFHPEPNKLHGYDVDALKAVYFGSSVNLSDIESVCLILQGQSKNIKFYRASKDKSSYSLNFEEFTPLM